jgi:hypothetical protein
MQYLLLIYGDESRWEAMSPQEQAAEYQKWSQYGSWLEERGWVKGGAELHPTSRATTVRVRDGQTLTSDGPFAETKEQLGGYYLIECDDLDQAIEAAGRMPAANAGSIEIRPIVTPEERPTP